MGLQDERLQMTREEWMRQYGALQRSEEWFEEKQARIMSQDTYRGEKEDRTWYKMVGRDHGKEPLWMKQQVRCCCRVLKGMLALTELRGRYQSCVQANTWKRSWEAGH